MALDRKENFFTLDLKIGKVYFDLSTLDDLLLLIFSFNLKFIVFQYNEQERGKMIKLNLTSQNRLC